MHCTNNFNQEKGRRVETNFREKVTGDGVQPLFKSNILNYGGNKGEQELERNENSHAQEKSASGIGMSKKGAVK